MSEYDKVHHYLELIKILNNKTNIAIKYYRWYRLFTFQLFLNGFLTLSCIALSFVICGPISFAIYDQLMNIKPILLVSNILLCIIVTAIICLIAYTIVNNSDNDVEKFEKFKRKYNEIKESLSSIHDDYDESKIICVNIINEQLDKLDKHIEFIKVKNI